MGGVGSGAKPKQYPHELVSDVRRFYALGMTQDEVAAMTGVSQKVVWNLMRRHGIKTRPQAKRNQRGRLNHMWRGDSAGYQALHLRVAAERGTPQECSVCGTTESDRTYEWANLTGNYADVSDYARMCRSCHRRYDNLRRGEVTDA